MKKASVPMVNGVVRALTRGERMGLPLEDALDDAVQAEEAARLGGGRGGRRTLAALLVFRPEDTHKEGIEIEMK